MWVVALITYVGYSAFNELLARRQEAFERQRRFTGDASHQLRTPLTAMLGQVEVALRRDRPPEEYRRVLDQVKWGANWHRGHVFTKGHSFKLLDDTFYLERFYDRNLDTMTRVEAVRFVVRAAIAFVTVPLPWTMVSRSELAFLPELLLLYVALIVLPIGIAAAWRRDALLTAVLCGYSIVSAGAIAITSGNVGTLVRHRALVVPFLVWFVASGAVEIIVALAQPARRRPLIVPAAGFDRASANRG